MISWSGRSGCRSLARDLGHQPTQPQHAHDDREDLPGVLLSNSKIELTVVPEGGAMAQIVLKDDKEKIYPLWYPYAIARQAGAARPTNF